MIPTPNTDHVAEAVALLTSRYVDTKVVRGLVTALTLRVQELEAQYWSLLNGMQLVNHPMPGGPWSILDQIGEIVLQKRLGLPDSAYAPLLRLKSRVNRSNGLSEDILGIARALLQTTPMYVDYPLAAFYLGAWNLDPIFAQVMPAYIAQARPAGVYCELAYSSWPDGNDFEFCDANNPTTTGQGVFDDGTGTLGGLLVSGVQA